MSIYPELDPEVRAELRARVEVIKQRQLRGEPPLFTRDELYDRPLMREWDRMLREEGILKAPDPQD